jgi:hypothetical protein
MRRAESTLVTITLLGLTLSCGKTESSARTEDGVGEVSVDTELDCDRRGYPCTWAEIDAAVIERTVALSDVVEERLSAGEPTNVVAAWLEEDPDMAEVMHDSLLIRFRMEGGRAVWLGTPAASRAGIRGGGTAPDPAIGTGASALIPLAASPKADAVGEQTPGDRPVKAFLFVDPYRWEYKLDVFSGLIEVDDDASHTLPRLFREVRDYKCAPGKRCPCPNGKCYDYRGNDWVNYCDPASPTCNIERNVTLEDFKVWAKYDAIHVATHGYFLCDANGCANGLASGEFVRGDLLPGPMQADTKLWALERGIDLWRLGNPPGSCDRLTRGTPGYAHAFCDVAASIAPHHRVWRVYLNLDFFKDAYPPGKLEDKLIMLFACNTSSGRTSIADYLAGANRENAVVGWAEVVRNSHQSMAATRFYKSWLKGKTAREAFDEVRTDPDYIHLDFHGGGTIMRGGGATAGGTMEGQTSNPLPGTLGLDRKRGVETVYLIDPETGIELADNGVLALTTASGDGRPDTLDALIEVVGLEPSDEPSGYVLRARVDGRDAPMTARLTDDVGDGVHRFRGPIDLGFDLAEDTPVDVEISADLPDGGETRWLYYDVVPGGACSWSGTVGGATPSGGAIGGRWGGYELDRQGIGNPLGIDGWPGDGEPEDHWPPGPWLTIRLENRAFHNLSDMSGWRGLVLAIPGAPPGTTGTFRRVPAALEIGEYGFHGNAQYLVRNVIGIPGGTGIGNLMTTDVTITRNDGERVEGTFQGRFLDESMIPEDARRPFGVGIHDFPSAEIRVDGEFRIAAGTDCRTRVRRPSRLPLP